MNEFFVSVFTKGPSTLPDTFTNVDFPIMPDITFEKNKIENILKELNEHKAPGPDNIPAALLKRFSGLFADILYNIYTKSYESGIVPDLMKTANVVQLLKSGEKTLPNNFRPVSLTPIVVKTLNQA